MALITSQSERIAIPHEPDNWIEIRPLRAGDLGLFTMAGDQVKVSHELLAAVVVAWSYGEMPTDPAQRLELVKQLDLDTYLWAYNELGGRLSRISGIRSEPEKKESSTPSSPRTGLVEAASPRNSLISV